MHYLRSQAGTFSGPDHGAMDEALQLVSKCAGEGLLGLIWGLWVAVKGPNPDRLRAAFGNSGL